MLQKSLLLTKREIEVINKKLKNKKITQQDSNYLSRFVRPKLREMNLIDSKLLLDKLDYNQKIPAIEKRVRHIILTNIKNVNSITLYGSVVYNNYKGYNDIDVLVTVKKKFWKNLSEKYSEIIKLKKKAKKYGLNLDLEIYENKTLYNSYSSNLSLIYQLKDSKTIYGILKLPSEIKIPRLEIRMKIDYSIIDEEATGLEIYKAIRGLWLINLALNKTIDNLKLLEVIKDELGKNLVYRLKTNTHSKTDKKIALLYLNKLLKTTLKTIDEAKWEKIVL